MKMTAEQTEAHRIRNKAWRERNPKWSWVVSAVGGARLRARQAGDGWNEANITNEYLMSITPDTCPVFGTTFTFVGLVKQQPCSPSLDRIDPDGGYVVGNVAVISMKANAIKSNATPAEVARVLVWMKSVEKIKLKDV